MLKLTKAHLIVVLPVLLFVFHHVIFKHLSLACILVLSMFDLSSVFILFYLLCQTPHYIVVFMCRPVFPAFLVKRCQELLYEVVVPGF